MIIMPLIPPHGTNKLFDPLIDWNLMPQYQNLNILSEKVQASHIVLSAAESFLQGNQKTHSNNDLTDVFIHAELISCSSSNLQYFYSCKIATLLTRIIKEDTQTLWSITNFLFLKDTCNCVQRCEGGMSPTLQQTP